MVFYRKYRPQTLVELDKEDIRTRLTAILQSGRIPHAFLFAGPKGTGKTSTARIVAKVLNCERTSIEPCDKCENCTAIKAGSHIDVYEIDAASSRGIDEIRELRERVALSPAMAKYKVYIIDEVHMLTREAFNALLKTLEEPPGHVVFILATTEIHKLPDTILSRCVLLPFTKATNDEITRSLQRVINGEQLRISEESVKLIAHHADGSFRDATKLLEQAVAEGKLDTESIRSLLGVAHLGVDEFVALIHRKKTPEALSLLQERANSGVDFTVFTQALIEFLHTQLLLSYQTNSEKKSVGLTKGELKQLLKVFTRAHLELRGSVLPQLPLELVVIEWCEGNQYTNKQISK
ncbi:DNA polymerase III subunit gamma/tau [Candidatus Roizmanbacteria bacterium]|nr:DNA polymerase III subunit gamma/tau [Candidatus Roizmanbacteria bacterium]